MRLENRFMLPLLLFTLLFLAATSAYSSPFSLGAGVLAPATHIFADSGQSLTIVAGNHSHDVALGDVDGDGDLDAYVVQGSFGTAQPNVLWQNDGDGYFTESTQDLGSMDSLGVALADLDGDGDLDAFIANNGPNEVWINQGLAQAGTQGVFLNSEQSLGDARSMAVAVGDLDDDGDLDAVVANQTVGNQIWWNDGAAIFSAGPTLGAGFFSSEDVALGHLNEDDELDIVFVSGNGDEDRIYWNDMGAFTTETALSSGGISNGVQLADLDDDGQMDIIVGKNGDNVIWWNDGEEMFVSAPFPDELNSVDIGIGPIDADATPDLFIVNSIRGNDPSTDRLWLNSGSRNLVDANESLGNDTGRAVALGDLNGDQTLDAFVANSGPNKVWFNQGGAPPPPPPLGVGLHFEDSLQFNYISDSNAVALGDLNGDGDLDAFLANGPTVGGAPNEVYVNEGRFLGSLVYFSDSGQRLGTASSQDVALGDIDLDGHLDAFVVNWSSAIHLGGGRVWLNDGDGVFNDGGQSTAQLPSTAVALGDLNGDGDLDAFGVNFGRPHFVYNNVLSGDEFEFIGTGQDLGTNANQGYDVALDDLNGDGHLDAFVADGSGSQVWLNDGNEPIPYFTQTAQVLPPASAVALGDLNGDAYVDAFTGNKIFFNQGDGTFVEQDQPLPANAGAVGLADLDIDGDLDAFAAYGNNQPNRALVNMGNGVFVDGDIALGAADSKDVALGDVDGDGDVDAVVANVASPNKVWLNYSCAVEWLADFELFPSALPRPVLTTVQSLRQATIDLQTFYRVRDEVLNPYPGGQRYTDLYYSHNAEILALLMTDAGLRDQGAATLELWQPNLLALLDGDGDEVTITQQQVQAIDAFLTNLSAAGSESLRQTIADERARLQPSQDYVGMTMAEAHGNVVGDTLYLPLLIYGED